MALVGASGRSVGIVVAATSATTACGCARSACSTCRTATSTAIATIGSIQSGTFFIARSYRQALEDARRTDDRGGSGSGERYLDDFDTKSRSVRIIDVAVLTS